MQLMGSLLPTELSHSICNRARRHKHKINTSLPKLETAIRQRGNQRAIQT
jgi:hypothetical protein